MAGATPVEIPNRSLFRQPEVCEIAQVQLYMLRSWEAEFPDLGVAKTAGGPRVYRRADLERVLRLRRGEPLTVSDGAGGWRAVGACRLGRRWAVDPAGAGRRGARRVGRYRCGRSR